MPLIVWSPSLQLGVRAIDDEHLMLVGYINQLHDAMRERRGNAVLGGILDELVKYTDFHFGNEERLMRQTDYRRRPTVARHDHRTT